MKNWLPVLALLAGLGSSISFSQNPNDFSPFDRYIEVTRAGRFGPALNRVADQCGVRLKQAAVRFAERPDGVWKSVRRFPFARRDQATDFFSTAAIWRSGNKVVVELWWMDSEAGEQTRTLYCLQNREILSGEEIQWNSESQNDDGSTDPKWAYEVRWNVEQKKFLKATLEGFVDDKERPVPKPVLSENAQKTFGLIPEMLHWSDLKLPDSLLR
jgi:hypothetical protein